jgi:hypothetical protein
MDIKMAFLHGHFHEEIYMRYLGYELERFVYLGYELERFVYLGYELERFVYLGYEHQIR